MLTFCIFPGTPKSVMMETAKTGISICRATITSGTVDIPTVSAPILRTYKYSAGVYNEGPVNPA